MLNTRKPAEAFPIGEFIKDEMEARGWTIYDVADAMGDGDRATWALTVDLLIECSDNPGVTLDVETAQRLGRAFGTSADLWLALHNGYVQWREAKTENREVHGK